MPESMFAGTLKREFARYGFTDCPLSDDTIAALEGRGFDVDAAYEVGCDVAAGIPLDQAIDANAPGE